MFTQPVQELSEQITIEENRDTWSKVSLAVVSYYWIWEQQAATCGGLIMLICRQVAQGCIVATYHFPKFQCAVLFFFLFSFWWNVNKLHISSLFAFSINVISVLWSHRLPEIIRGLFMYMYTCREREEEHNLVTRNCSFKKCWTQTWQVIYHIC